MHQQDEELTKLFAKYTLATFHRNCLHSEAKQRDSNLCLQPVSAKSNFIQPGRVTTENRFEILGMSGWAGGGGGVAAELQMLTSNLPAGRQGSGLEPQASERIEMFFGIMRT